MSRFGRSVLVMLAVVLAAPRLLSAQAEPAKPPAPNGDAINEEQYAKDANTEINVKNADIGAIIRIFSRKTKRNYILDEKVRGKVSIYLPGKVSAEESLRILDAVLALKGFTSVPIGENIWKIVPSKEARQSTIPTRTEDFEGRASAAVVTRLLALKFVGAEEVQQILQPLISADGLINAYASTNSLILIDSEDNIERLVRLVEELDVPSTNREMTIIPIKFADAADIAQKLTDILGEKKADGSDIRARGVDPATGMIAPVGLGVPPQGMPVAAGSGRSAGRGSAKGREPKIIPDERTNSIIVVADDETTARVRALVSQLDSKLDLSGNKFYVYRCQHADAEELAQVLAGLMGEGGSTGGTGNRTSSSLSGQDSTGGLFGGGGAGGTGTGSSRSGSNQNRSIFGNSGARSSLTGSTGSNSQGNRGTGSGPSTAKLGDDLSITADPATNSLVIIASKGDYEKIVLLLSQLDVKRRQVLVEATLLEVSVDESINTGFDFLTSTGGKDGGALIKSDFGGQGNSLGTLFTNPANLQGLSIAAASAGSLKLPGGLTLPTQAVLITALQLNNNVNVLSAPTILATDNEPAQIVVGQNVPFLASTSSSETNLNNTFNQVERQDVGITLRITPQISSRDYVTLQIFTEVSAVVPSTLLSSLGPTTNKRQSETTVIAKDAQMIVTGGLMSDDVSETDEGVPYLKDIPVLGHVFKDNSQARSQKNLLIFITPRIVKDQFDARDQTISKREKMEDVIKAYEVDPNRNDFLNTEDIDHVAESKEYTGPKPGTIRPPKNLVVSKKTSAERPDVEAADLVIDGSKPTSEGVLELDVAPHHGSPEHASYEPPEIEISETIDTEQGPEAVSGERYVVFEITSSTATDVPFLKSKNAKIYGVVMPGDTTLHAREFFQVGKDYVYQGDVGAVRSRVVGVFKSAADAKEFYSDLGEAWYTLSPYEVMNLGTGPWIGR